MFRKAFDVYWYLNEPCSYLFFVSDFRLSYFVLFFSFDMRVSEDGRHWRDNGTLGNRAFFQFRETGTRWVNHHFIQDGPLKIKAWKKTFPFSKVLCCFVNNIFKFILQNKITTVSPVSFTVQQKAIQFCKTIFLKCVNFRWVNVKTEFQSSIAAEKSTLLGYCKSHNYFG